MYVIYHSSESFGPVTAVSIVSLLENNKNASDIHILYIEKGMKQQTKEKLTRMVESYGRTIEFMPMPNWSERLGITLRSCKSGWLGFGYNRLFLTEILPEDVDRVLYLDSDTLVEGDITGLFTLDMEDYYLAAVDDCLSKTYRPIVEMHGDGVYCNAGVLLMNIKKWREDGVTQQLIDYVVERNGYFVFNEQSILNSFFEGKILVLPCAYNTNSLVFCFEYEELLRLRQPKNYSYSNEEFYEARNNPIITHFTGCFYVNRRPWIKDSDHPHAPAYDRYYALTPWAGEPYMEDNRSNTSQMGAGLSHALPRPVMIGAVNLLYTRVRVAAFKRKMREMRKKEN